MGCGASKYAERATVNHLRVQAWDVEKRVLQLEGKMGMVMTKLGRIGVVID